MAKACANDMVRLTFRLHDNNGEANVTFQRPNINTVYNGEYSLRWFGPIV